MQTLTDELKTRLDTAFGSGSRPSVGSVILFYNQKYGSRSNESRFEVSILDREDLPVIDMTSNVWVLGLANEDLFDDETYIDTLLRPADLTYALIRHPKTEHRRHGYWIVAMMPEQVQ